MTNPAINTVSCAIMSSILPSTGIQDHNNHVYFPTDADGVTAAEILQSCECKYENQWPDGLIRGDFNACYFQGKIPTYEEAAPCSTPGNNTLHELYCNVKNVYRAFQRSQLGKSDHNMIFCMPNYKQGTMPSCHV